MEAIRNKVRIYASEAGFWCLCITLFLLSFPRSWSLYSLGLMLFAGLMMWLNDFRNISRRFLRWYYLLLPPILYFIIHFTSVLYQKSDISILEGRLMFLLVPLLGFPVFLSSKVRVKKSYALTAFIAGLIVISLYQLGRILLIISDEYPGNVSFFTWLNQHDPSFFSLGFSIFEHPTYFALKLNWAIIFLAFFRSITAFSKIHAALIIILFSAALVFAASKAGLAILVIILMITWFLTLRRGISKQVFPAGLIIIMICLTVFLSLRINRINVYFTEIKNSLLIENPDLRNIDQRTREWYSAFQIIREEPLTGTGFAKAEERLVQEYLKNGFNDEASLKLNAHNQFLEAQMTFGIAGSASLLLMLLAPLIFRKKIMYPRLATAFILIMSFFLFFESMFNRQWGIMFFLLFYFILAIPKQTPEENIKPE